MLKKIFISAILLLAVLAFVLSLLRGNNNKENVVQVHAYIAEIDISGAITSGEGEGSVLGNTVGASSGTVMEEIRKAAEDKNVKGLLLRINSPGGSVTAAEEIGRELERFKKNTGKPIYVSMGDMAASAGYWLAACQSDKIYANASTMTGSIGVYMPYMNTEELYKKIGIQTEKIKSGAHKDIMSPARPMTPEERDILQKMVNEMYEQFITVVATGRNLDVNRVRVLADGRVYTGKQAKELGLVDEIGNYYDALDALGEATGLGAKPPLKPRERKWHWNMLFNAGLKEIVRMEAQELLQDLHSESAVPNVKG